MTNYYNSLCSGRDTVHKKTRFGASGGSPNTTKTSRWWLASLFMVMSMFVGQFVSAQVSTYTFAESTETYAQITGTTSTAIDDDGIQLNIPIGFNFSFGGVSYSSFAITTNGMIRLNATALPSGWTNSLGNTATLRPLIAPFWDDNNLSTGTIRYALTGTPGSQVLTVNWHNTKVGGGGSTAGASVSCLVRLYEGTNVIEMVYGTPFTTTNTVSASVGLNDMTSFLSVTPAATSTVSSTTANNSINATAMANLAGKKLTFTPPPIVLPPNCVANPTSPANAATSVVSNVLTWPAATGSPTGYKISFGTDAAATNIVNGLNIGNVTTYTLSSPLTAATQYFWKVTPYNANGDNTTCTIWSFTSGDIPSCPSTLLPADASSDVARNPTLTWTAATGNPASYDVYFGTSPSPAFVVNQTALSYSPGLLAANTTYYWNVVAKNIFGDAVGCVEQSFTTGVLLNYCTPIYTSGKTSGDLISNISITGTTLSNNSGTAQVNPAFTFFTGQPNYTGDLQAGGTYSVNVTVGTWGSQAIKAWIDYDDDGVFESTEVIGTSVIAPGQGNTGPFPPASFSISLACNPPLGIHRMRVRSVWNVAAASIDPCTSAGFGETEDYLVNITTADPCPIPKNLASSTITSSGATLNWELGCAETQWDVHVQLATDPAPTAATTPSNPGLTATTLVASTLNQNTAYNVYVRAVCDLGLGVFSAWSTPVTFTTQGVANCATALVPADLTVDIARNPTLSWTASASNPAVTGYDVYFGNAPSAPIVSAAQTGLTYSPAILAANTTYYWRVVAKNSIGDAVGCVEQSFTTGTTINYCTPVYTSGKTAGDLISNISITGTTLSNNSGTAQTNPAYTFFTGQPNYTGDLQAGGTYNVNVAVGTWGNQAIKAWIDYDDDGVFETTEVIGTSVIAPGQGNTGPFPAASFPISLSCDPPVGEHRLRVRSVWNVAAASIDPCTSADYGETEDYVINITAPDPCPAPKNLAAASITNSAASLSWVLGCAETEWDVNVQLAGSGVPTSANNVGLTSTTLAVSGLDAATAYEYYVRAVCETGVTYSTWAGPFTFTTLPNAPGCTVVDSPADGATGVTVGTIPFSWTAPAVSPTEGAATSYDLYYGTSATPGVANTLIGNFTTTSASIILTGYNSTFYLRVVPKNSGGTAVGPCTVTSFTTEADPFIPYCSSVTYTTDIEPISSVNFAGINNTSSNVVDGSPSIENFTAVSGNVTANNSYTMTIKGHTGGDFTTNLMVFADWNQDGDFADAGETYNAGSLTNSNGIDAVSAVSTIAVPVNALPGTTRLRIKKMFGAADNNPCVGAGYGQTEDYTLNVTGFTTNIAPSSCGSTLANIYSSIFANIKSGATGYRFRVVGGSAGTQTIDRGIYHWFSLTQLPSYEYGTTYTVDVMLQVDGVWADYYGPSCTVTTPGLINPTLGSAVVSSPSCGSELAKIYTSIYTTPKSGATGYRFRVVRSGGETQVIDRTQHFFNLTQLPVFVYGAEYTVEVAFKTTGDYTPYGVACTLFSPTVPTIVECGLTRSSGSTLSVPSLPSVTNYAFEVTNMTAVSAPIIINRSVQWMPVTLIPGYSTANVYSVKVAVTSSGVQSDYGLDCTINESPALKEVNSVVAFKVQAFPNPFTNNFTLAITRASEENVSVIVYDMIGKVLDRINVNATENSLELGANYPAGVYNVVVSQGEKVETVRMIKN